MEAEMNMEFSEPAVPVLDSGIALTELIRLQSGDDDDDDDGLPILKCPVWTL